MRQKLVNCIRDQNYGMLVKLLQSDRSMTDQGLFSLAKMTGLEWAVYWEDWKMTAIFFVFGADPEHNIFDGIMGMPPGYVPLPSFVNPGQPVPGFAGLHLLLDEEENEEYGKAYLKVMQVCYNGTLDIRRDLPPLLPHLDTVKEDLKLSDSDCKNRTMATLLCLRKVGIPDEIADRIAGEMIVGTLWDAFQEHAMSNPIPSEDPIWRGLVEDSATATATAN